jgi:hypothetical protein
MATIQAMVAIEHNVKYRVVFSHIVKHVHRAITSSTMGRAVTTMASYAARNEAQCCESGVAGNSIDKKPSVKQKSCFRSVARPYDEGYQSRQIAGNATQKRCSV